MVVFTKMEPGDVMGSVHIFIYSHVMKHVQM